MSIEKRITSNLSLNKPYVIEKNCTWSYLDLNKMVLYVNSFIFSKKIKKLLISSTQGFYSYSFIISSYLSGITFCVANPTFSEERNKEIIKKFIPDAIICDENNLRIFKSQGSCPIYTISSFLKKYSTCYNYKIIKSEINDIAYIIFTSGSTGLPKGVAIKRIAIEKLVEWAIQEFEITADEIYAQFSPIHFDMCMLDIFGGTAAGATLVPFADKADKLFPGKLIKKHKITFWNSVPQIIVILKNSKQLNYDTLRSLKKIKLGGDKVYKYQLDILFDVIPDINIILTYGPTEVTVFCTYLKLNKVNYTQYFDECMAIGRCVPGWHLHIDKSKEDFNETGEIVVYGKYIGSGYLNSDSVSFRKILINGRYYDAFFTGDYGYQKHDVYFIKGRKDNQIKINGNRFELNEIDYQLRKLGCLDTCTLFLGGKIYAFYVASKISEDEAKQFLKSKLPNYGIPHFIKRISMIPLNMSGKPDISRLKKILGFQNG